MTMAEQDHPRDRLMINLQKHAGLSTEEIEKFKCFALMADYFSRDDHVGGMITPDRNVKRYRADGTEHTFNDVPLHKLLRDVESHIKSKVLDKKRTNVFKKVMTGIPGAKALPDWERPIVSPHDEPEFEWSVSRAPRKSRKSNEQLIAALAKKAKLSDSAAKMIAVQITWWDAMGDDKRPASMWMGADARVYGGRLGRDHTLADVPNHYARDRLMNYIQTQIPEDTRETALRAVFNDLSSSEIELYGTAVLDKQRALEEKEEPLIRVRTGDTSAASAQNLADQEAAFDAIDSSIDLTPKPGCYTRNYDVPLPLISSVLTQDAFQTDTEMDSFSYETDIDRDCDQIRAMVKIFIQEEKWSLDQFGKTLGVSIPRPAMVKFLKCKGPTAGKKQHLYQLSWEFFKRRELLGFPIKQRVDNALKEVDSNRHGRKRKANGKDAQDKKKVRAESTPVTTRSSRLRSRTAK